MIFSGLYFMMSHAINQQSSAIITDMANEERLAISSDAGKGFNKIFFNSFFIKINHEKNILDYSSASNISKQEIEELKNTVLSKKTQMGNIEYKHFKLRFLKQSKNYGYIIVFLDNSMALNIQKSLVVSSFAIGLLSLALVFILSMYLANKAMIPIKNSWEKQSAFIADASHELRTPLAVLNSNLEIVIENEDKTVLSQAKWLNNIQGEIKRMTKLVDDLLFLARAEEEKMPMYDFNISDTLIKSYESFTPLSAKKEVTLNFNIEPNIIINGNEGRILQLVNILLDNALKHTPPGGKINMLFFKDEYFYKLLIKDTGEGIPKESINKIFERFYRVDKARSRNQGGSGLGLSIAKCIVKEHRGTIKVSSNEGNGAEFLINFPIANIFHKNIKRS